MPRVPNSTPVKFYRPLPRVPNDVVEPWSMSNLRFVSLTPLRSFLFEARVTLPSAIGVTGRVQLALSLLDLIRRWDDSIFKAISDTHRTKRFRIYFAAHPAPLLGMDTLDLVSTLDECPVTQFEPPAKPWSHDVQRTRKIRVVSWPKQRVGHGLVGPKESVPAGAQGSAGSIRRPARVSTGGGWIAGPMGIRACRQPPSL